MSKDFDKDEIVSYGREALTKGWIALAVMATQPPKGGKRLMATLTFGGDVPGPQRGRKAIKKWLKDVEGTLHGAFITEERGSENDRLHYHAILAVDGGDTAITSATLRGKWHQGYSKIEQVRNEGGLRYVVKYCVKETGEASWFEAWNRHDAGVQGMFHGI